MLSRMRRRLLVTLVLLVACSPVPVASSSPPVFATPATLPSVSPIAAASPSPSQPPVVAAEYKPRLLLSIQYAPTAGALGGTTARVGGLSPKGVTTFAVDEHERIYIWDRARLRVAIYESGRFVRAIAMPYAERESTSLLVDGDRIYLSGIGYNVSGAYEVDAASGRLLQIAASASVLFPRERWKDDLGNTYETDDRPVHRYVRSDGRGEVAYAVEPLSLKGLDHYARRDGALYELAADFGGEGYAYVYALMPPAGNPPAPPTPSTRPAPIAFGRGVPDRLTAVVPGGGGSVELDAELRTAFWWLAGMATPAINISVPPQDARFEARWNDGSAMFINADGTNLSEGATTYRSSSDVWGQLAAYAAAAPSRISSLLASSGGRLRIADLPSTERALTSAEIASVRAALANAFSVSEGELPGDLERPFPVYEITIGDVVVQLRRDHYAAVGRYGAFAHDGGLYDVVRRALPIPSIAATDPHSLFLADKVTIAEDGYPDRTQDISRWKASIVRALVGVGLNLGSVDSVDLNPLTLTFAFAGGRTETVRVTRDAYTYRGVSYARPGVIAIVGLRGVP